MPEPIVGQRFSIPGSGSTRLALLSNLPLDQPQPNVQRAIISIHGSGSPAHKYYVRALQAVRGVDGGGTLDGQAVANELRMPGEILVIAPQFIAPGDYQGPGPIPPGVLYWNGGFWGEDAVNGGNPSSFLILDELIKHLCDGQRYRRLDRIVLVGHSGGGQLLNRYAAAGEGETRYARPRNIGVRYIVLNPGSYMYFDPQRRTVSSEDNFALGSAVGCPGFDWWGFGTAGGLPTYLTTQALGPAQLEARNRDRDVVYLNGSEDSDPNSSSLPSTCGAMYQGDHRLERSRTYFNYLVHHFGTDIMKHQQHAIVPGVGHSGGRMLRSSITRRFLLEDYENKPRLTRVADSGNQAGKISRVFLMRHWDDLGENSDDQFMAAVRDGSNKLKLIGWRILQDGTVLRVNSSEATPDSARSIGMVRVHRTDALPGGNTEERLTYVTSYVTSGSRMRLASWDSHPQGTTNRLAFAGRNASGGARLVRIVRLTDSRFATVQKTTGNRLMVKSWTVDSGGTITRIDSTGMINGAVDEVQVVRRSRSFFVVVANTPNQNQVRILHLQATATGSNPGTLTINWDQTLANDTGTDLCTVIGPYGRPRERLVVGYRDSAGARLRLVSFAVSSNNLTRLYDSGNQVGQIETGTSMMAMSPYGICTAVRTQSGKGKLLFWRMAPGGALQRVVDTGSSLGKIGRHHSLADHPSVVTSDLLFGCSDFNGKLKLISFRYKS